MEAIEENEEQMLGTEKKRRKKSEYKRNKMTHARKSRDRRDDAWM